MIHDPLQILCGGRIIPNLDGGGAKDRADVVGLLNSLLGVPDNTVTMARIVAHKYCRRYQSPSI